MYSLRVLFDGIDIDLESLDTVLDGIKHLSTSRR
jgi:hypothetical protein